jgi:hypothetical protein
MLLFPVVLSVDCFVVRTLRSDLAFQVSETLVGWLLFATLISILFVYFYEWKMWLVDK